MRGSFFLTMAIFAGLASMFAGCQSDPYCQNAIANLRAEKIQMENQYYELKALYEADMARRGQPVPTVAPSVSPAINGGEVIYGNQELSGFGPFPGTIISDSGTITPRLASQQATGSTDAEMAGYIQSIEVNQLSPQSNETVRLLVRPLDDQGAILPIAGDIKIRMYEPSSGVTVFENTFSSDQVAAWINDQSGLQPGIHIALRQDQKLTQSDKLICDLQYRTKDNRILKQSSGIVFNNKSPMSNRSAQPQRRTRNTSTPMKPAEGMEGDINIEFGEELNFDSLNDDSSKSRPRWNPDR